MFHVSQKEYPFLLLSFYFSTLYFFARMEIFVAFPDENSRTFCGLVVNQYFPFGRTLM